MNHIFEVKIFVDTKSSLKGGAEGGGCLFENKLKKFKASSLISLLNISINLVIHKTHVS